MGDYIYDPQGDDDRLKRKRRLAELMANKTWDPYPATIDAGAFKVANWGDAVGQLAKAWASGRAEKDLTSDEASTLTNQRNYEADKTAEYQKAKVGNTFDTGARDDMGTGYSTGHAAPDFNKALAIAMTSKIPALAKLAEGERTSREAYLKIPGATVASRTEAYNKGDPSAARGTETTTNVNGQIVRTDEAGNSRVAADFGDKFEPVAAPPGATPGQQWERNTRTGETRAVGRGPLNNITLDNRGESAFARAQGEAISKRINEDFPRMRDHANRLPTIQALLPMVDQAQTGFGADAIINVRRLAKQLNLSDDAVNKIGNSQTLLAGMAPAVMDMLKALRPASNQDLAWTQKVTMADLANDPRAMKYAMGLVQSGMMNDMQDYNNFYTSSREAMKGQEHLLDPYKPPQFSGGEATGVTMNAMGKFVPVGMDAPPVGGKGAPTASTSTPAGQALQKPAGMPEAKWQRYLELKKLEAEGGLQ